MFLKAVPKALLNKSQIFNDINKLYGYCVDNILQIVDYNIRQGFRRFYPEILQKKFIRIEILGEYWRFLIKDDICWQFAGWLHMA